MPGGLPLVEGVHDFLVERLAHGARLAALIAGGILLLPKDLREGEKRPVVVCQHGLEGVPMDTISKTVDGFKYYSAFTAELANRGFITYAPQNPYRGGDRFRRGAHAIKIMASGGVISPSDPLRVPSWASATGC